MTNFKQCLKVFDKPKGDKNRNKHTGINSAVTDLVLYAL